ncbi:MAG TPA: MFS transporter [Anaerolineae bacterium]|nr:MFS transporter [Anaerolineae bacterium]HIQ06742.1 MFS transporter [Anaerolineae bacterium]
MASQPEIANFRSVLRHRDFRLLWVGQVISQAGDSFYFLAVLITVNQLTASTLAVGLATISFSLPQLLFGLLAGVLVDRFDRRRIMMVSDLLRGILVLLCLTVRQADQVWLFYIVGFVLSSISVFFIPSKSATIPLLVESRELLSANALSLSTQTAAMLIGPAAAGFVIGYFGSGPAFVVDSVSFFISAFFISRMRVHTAPIKREDTNASMVWRELKEGLRTVRDSRLLKGFLAMLAIVMLGVGAINVLWVPYMDRYFGIGPEGLGILDSIQGAGMLVGALLVGNLASRFQRVHLLSGGILFISLCLGGIGLAPSFWVVMVLTFLLGVFLPPAQAAGDTLVQVSVPNEKLGRVNSVTGTAATAANVVSMALAAVLGDLMDIRIIYAACGVLGLLSSMLGFVVLREPEAPSTVPAARPAPTGAVPKPTHYK